MVTVICSWWDFKLGVVTLENNSKLFHKVDNLYAIQPNNLTPRLISRT